MCLAIPGKIVSIEGENPLEKKGKVSFGGVLKEVSLAYTPDARIGNYVVVHVGFALNVIDEEEAQKTLTILNQVL
ncbi:HypC/HybG/HupF family hydrogenase formation chaperone [Geminocystis herdmanii]|uniref:HypC/HybG/HupF family hydrogenase formation chaperone n=1 Tax=Geminocystis herdmanii TaxID=669359 RepID=UPI00034980E2|nr:HypC/HybG/HupF family hydrogenase formation chaperone [Geminocystis herdmanii]